MYFGSAGIYFGLDFENKYPWTRLNNETAFSERAPFSKSTTPEVKSFAGSFVTSPLLLNGFSASENPLYPEPIRTEQGRQEGRKKGGREGRKDGWMDE